MDKESPERTPESAILELLGEEPSAENMEHLGIFLEAFYIYVERNRRHNNQWRNAGSKGLLVDVRKKNERLWNEFMMSVIPPSDYDSAFDEINYLAFFIRARREEAAGNVVGTWSWPTLRK